MGVAMTQSPIQLGSMMPIFMSGCASKLIAELTVNENEVVDKFWVISIALFAGKLGDPEVRQLKGVVAALGLHRYELDGVRADIQPDDSLTPPKHSLTLLAVPLAAVRSVRRPSA